MQPSWRVANGAEEAEQLSRDTPAQETWQSLKKGGTAGIYVVIVGLSWWVAAQNLERDENLWAVVDDVSWILQEITKVMLPSTSSNKRTRDSDENDESGGKRKKRYASTFMSEVYHAYNIFLAVVIRSKQFIFVPLPSYTSSFPSIKIFR